MSVALAAAWTTLAASCVDLSVPLDDASSGQPGTANPGSDAGSRPPVVDASRDPDPIVEDLATPPLADGTSLADGLVAHWLLDEDQGSRFEDLGAAGPGWALEGASWMTADLPAPLGSGDKSALRFDGANAYATLGVQGLPANGEPRTISLWFNLAKDPTIQQDFISLTDGVGTALNLSVRNGLLVAAGWGGAVLVSVTSPGTGEWHHLAYSFDKTANRLYLDGALMALGTAVPQKGPVAEGWLASSRARTDFFAGKLDDIRIYDRALTNGEVNALANGVPVPAPSGPRDAAAQPPIRNLVGYWKFDEAVPSGSFVDSSGNGLTAKGVHNPQPAAGAPRLAFPNPHSLSFSGNQCAIVDNPAALNFAGLITLTAWVNISTRSGTQTIIAHGPADTETGLRLDGNAYVIYSASGNNSHRATFPIPAEDVGSWVHLAGSYDGMTWRLYRNGDQVGASNDSVGALLVNGNWSMGGNGTCSDRFYRGGMDDVRIYHGDVSAADVARIAAGTD
ncbi:MAG TPA: LamG domain-containing protein [Polyangia bacterium]|jgi:hypothetical protein|nr:LamG domain-containing protein [Polyangia bacterium]